MSEAPMSPEERARCYASLRYAIRRIDMVVGGETGMGYFDDFVIEDEDTGDYRDVVLDDDTKLRYHRALARQFELFLSTACPRATVLVTQGEKYSLTFAREGAHIYFSNEEIWDAIMAFDYEWSTELCAQAYASISTGEKSARPRLPQPAPRRQSSRRRRR